MSIAVMKVQFLIYSVTPHMDTRSYISIDGKVILSYAGFFCLWTELIQKV